MSKRVLLRLEGNLNQGFKVRLEIGEEGAFASIDREGELPANPELAQCLHEWRKSYQALSQQTRIVLKKVITHLSPLSYSSQLDHCTRITTELTNRLQAWLDSPSFARVDQCLRETLNLDDSIRVLLQTPDRCLHGLPWHTWNLFKQYRKAELAFATPLQNKINLPRSTTSVKILAILGDSTGINVETDRVYLKALKNAEVKFLVEPSLKQISSQLWEQSWDILFFAGHSRTEEGKGRIFINAQESLTIADLERGLRQAIAQGLQLAIFNSCDGLGLAYELEQLHLPQLVVMREPVPDRLAQLFLKYFLSAYVQGESLYLSVRQARERLQEELQPELPCAEWLPVIYQNPAEIPPTWQDLGRSQASYSRPHHLVRLLHNLSGLQLQGLKGIGWRTLIVTAIIFLIRFGGLLQPLELSAFDQLMQMRLLLAPEGIDPNFLIIKITQADIDAQKQRGEQMQRQSTSARTRGETFDVSLSDASLNQLLAVLAKYQPRVIGLDIYRDFPAAPEQPELMNRLQSTPLISICKVADRENRDLPTIDPSPEVPIDRIGFSDFQTDSDSVLRRHLLGMFPENWVEGSLCRVERAFSFLIAAAYLKQDGIPLRFKQRGDYDDLQLGDRPFPILRSHWGGYQALERGGGGSQILLNYRATAKIAPSYSLAEVLSENINPSYIKDKVVLIGVTTPGDDYWATPYSMNNAEQMPGVVVHAHMISQLINAAHGERPLLWVWSSWQEFIWIGGWSFVAGVAVWKVGKRSIWRSLPRWGLAMIGTISLLYVLCFVILLNGEWVPFVPSALGIVLCGSSMAVHRRLITNHKSIKKISTHD